MKALVFALGMSGIAAFAASAEETIMEPKIESVGLFKNGLAVVRAVFPVSGPGVYRWNKVPRVVHGSFWIESDGEVSVRSTRRMVEETDASGSPTGNIQQDLAGRDVAITLKSGFPNVRFGAVDSPLWPGTELSAFFQQINQASSTRPFGGNALSQQLVYQNAISPDSSSLMPELPEAGNSSDDIHHESIGRHSLQAGDSLSINVAAASAKYERVVEWLVADGRDEYGRSKQDERNATDHSPWDAVRFTNPFSFPMTTAAALVMDDGKFRGQSQSDWVNPGQRACVKITRALSVRTEAGEVEEEGQRENVSIAGREYRRTMVKGRLVARNFRGKDVTLAIRCGFSGKLIEADGDPQATLRTEGIASVNPRRQLDWTIQIPAGKEKELNYRYEVLVRR